MFVRNALHITLLLAAFSMLLLTTGCGGSNDTTVIAPTSSDEDLRAETEKKLETLKNIDPESL